MKTTLTLAALTIVLLSGDVSAQGTTGAAGAPGSGITAPPATGADRLRPKQATPSITGRAPEDITGGSTLMPSTTLSAEPYSSIEPKGTWIGSMGIFKRSLLSKSGNRSRVAGLTGPRRMSAKAR